MLVLARKVEEKLVIDERITITVIEVSRRRVKLAIDAPKEMAIRRSELPPKQSERDDT